MTTATTTLVPVATAFTLPPGLDASLLPCRLTAYIVDASEINDAPATEYMPHDKITRATHTGWFVDSTRNEILTGWVYIHAEDPYDDDPDCYYAVVRSNDTDILYISPVAFDDMDEAARDADHLAQSIASLEHERNELASHAFHARTLLHEGRDTIKSALDIVRRHRRHPAEAPPLEPAFRRLWNLGRSTRARAWRTVDDFRPVAPPTNPPLGAIPSPQQTHADGWRDGWNAAA